LLPSALALAVWFCWKDPCLGTRGAALRVRFPGFLSSGSESVAAILRVFFTVPGLFNPNSSSVGRDDRSAFRFRFEAVGFRRPSSFWELGVRDLSDSTGDFDDFGGGFLSSSSSELIGSALVSSCDSCSVPVFCCASSWSLSRACCFPPIDLSNGDAFLVRPTRRNPAVAAIAEQQPPDGGQKQRPQKNVIGRERSSEALKLDRFEVSRTRRARDAGARQR
jgi:hypothetical protein